MKIFKVKFLLLIQVAFLSFGLVFAQVDVPAKRAAMIIADINIVKVIPAATSSPFSGTFSLSGRLGQQNYIVYGVIVMDDSNTVLDTKFLGDIQQIKEGETLELTYSYTLPETIKGDIRIFLVAETKQGLRLSVSQIFNGNIKGEEVMFPCSPQLAAEKSSIVCISSKDEDITVRHQKNSIFSPDIKNEIVSLKSGQKVELDPEVSPGKYFVTVTTSANEKRVFHFTKAGVYGEISSVVVHASDKIGEIKTVVFSNVSTSSIVLFNFIGRNGESCGSGNVEAKGKLAEFTLFTKCTQGVVNVSLKDRQGVVLSTSSQPFSVLSVKSTTDKDATPLPTESTMRTKIVYIILTVIVLIAAASVYFRKKYRPAEVVASN